eukprot:m.189908 g.189908  ORF g.189908 m.189908 type:complete len:283 (+) comp39424_c0_seq25:2480-3328(+)
MASVRYSIKLLLGDKGPIEKTIEIMVPDERTAAFTYLDLLRANEQAVAGVFRRLRKEGTITLIIDFKGMERGLNIPFANTVNLEKNGYAYSLVLELTDTEDDEDYDCYVWGRQQESLEVGASSSPKFQVNMTHTKDSVTTKGQSTSVADSSVVTMMAVGQGGVVNLGHQQQSHKEGSDSGASDGVQLGASDDRVPFIEVVCDVAQAKWKDVCIHLSFPLRELEAWQGSRPAGSGREWLRHFLDKSIADRGYSEMRKKVISACKEAKLMGALKEALTKKGLAL